MDASAKDAQSSARAEFFVVRWSPETMRVYEMMWNKAYEKEF